MCLKLLISFIFLFFAKKKLRSAIKNTRRWGRDFHFSPTERVWKKIPTHWKWWFSSDTNWWKFDLRETWHAFFTPWGFPCHECHSKVKNSSSLKCDKFVRSWVTGNGVGGEIKTFNIRWSNMMSICGERRSFCVCSWLKTQLLSY